MDTTELSPIRNTRENNLISAGDLESSPGSSSTDSSATSGHGHIPYTFHNVSQTQYYNNSVLRMPGHDMKSPNSIHALTTTLYAVDKESYEDQQQRFQAQCDTLDYAMDNEVVKSPTNSSYYSDHRHHLSPPNHAQPPLNGVIGNIQLVRAKTEEVSSYNDPHLSLKSSATLGHHLNHHHLGEEMLLQHDANNNNNNNIHGEPFLNLVPPPPHLAAELNRKCMGFNAEQVNTTLLIGRI